jgi:serine protease Do
LLQERRYEMIDENGFIKPDLAENQKLDSLNPEEGYGPPAPAPTVAANNTPLFPPQPGRRSNSGRGFLVWGLIIGLLLGSVFGSILGNYVVMTNPETFPWARTVAVTYPGTNSNASPTVVTSEEQAIEEVVKLVAPAVVRIDVTATSQNSVAPSSAPQEGLGSGFLVTPDGYILTNNHVVAGAAKITVILKDGREFSGQVVGTDPISDVALVKIKGSNFPTVQLGDSTTLTIGQEVIAIGNPYGLGQTVTTGIISALERNVQVSATENLVGVVQTDAAINPGNSGGPLLDLNGRVVGINTMIYQDAQGLGFSVSINTAKKVYATLLKDGKITWAMLGIQGITLTPTLAQQYNVKAVKGVYVGQITVGSGAETAGLKVGDVITTIDGQTMATIDEVLNYIRAKNVGDTVQIIVNRNGTTETFSVVLKALS